MSLRIYDLLELSGIPALGDTVGPAGADVDVLNGPGFMDMLSTGASLAYLYESEGTIAAPHSVETDGDTFNPMEIIEVEIEVDGQSLAAMVISLRSCTNGTTRYFLIPEDGHAMSGTETMTVTAVVDVSSVETANYDDNDGTPVCFSHGTLIATPEGPAPVECLSPGDWVTTLDRGPMRLLFVADCHATPQQQAARRGLRPVEIGAGAFGHGLPLRPLVVSPQHRLLVSGRVVQRMTGGDRALVSARTFAELPGLRWQAATRPVSYRHLLLERHALVCADSLPSESLWLGPMTERTLSPAQLARAHAALREAGAPPPAAACPILRGQQARRLLDRHTKNGIPLLDAPTANAVRRLEAVRRPAA